MTPYCYWLRRPSLSILLLAIAALAMPALATVRSTNLGVDPPRSAGPRVAIETSVGRIVVDLYPEKAPRTVANFLSYVRDGHYNGTIFHRVIADLLVQAGAYTRDLQHKPERAPIGNEADNGLSNLRGTIAAARRPSEKDSTTAQFFINTVDNRQLDHRGEEAALAGYCVFGRVIEGMEVIDKIRAAPTAAKPPFSDDVPIVPIVIERASVIED